MIKKENDDNCKHDDVGKEEDDEVSEGNFDASVPQEIPHHVMHMCVVETPKRTQRKHTRKRPLRPTARHGYHVSLCRQNAQGHVTRASLCSNLQARGPRVSETCAACCARACANRHVHEHFTRSISGGIVNHRHTTTATRMFCASLRSHAQSKGTCFLGACARWICTWISHSSHFMQKFTVNKPARQNQSRLTPHALRQPGQIVISQGQST